MRVRKGGLGRFTRLFTRHLSLITRHFSSSLPAPRLSRYGKLIKETRFPALTRKAMTAAASAYLVTRRDDGFGDVYPLATGHRYTMGRAGTNRIVLKDDRCSREHAEI